LEPRAPLKRLEPPLELLEQLPLGLVAPAERLA